MEVDLNNLKKGKMKEKKKNWKSKPKVKITKGVFGLKLLGTHGL